MTNFSQAHTILTLPAAMGIASTTVGLVFAYAALSKLMSYRRFVIGFKEYGILPARLVPAAATTLIVVECAIAFAHISGFALGRVIPVTIALLLLMLIATGRVLARGETRPCLCFSTSRDDVIDSVSFVRLLLLTAAEASLLSYLAFFDGSVEHIADDERPDQVWTLVIALTSAATMGLGLAVPKAYRAWNVIRS